MTPAISISQLSIKFFSTFHAPIEAFFLFSLLLYIVVPLFSKRGISVLSLLCVYYTFNGNLPDVYIFFRELKLFIQVKYPKMVPIFAYFKTRRWWPSILPMGDNQIYPNNPVVFPKSKIGTFSVKLFIKLFTFLPKVVAAIKSFFKNPKDSNPLVFFSGFNETSTIKFKGKLHLLSIRMTIFTLFYVWQFDGFVPVYPILYTWKYSPLHYIIIPIIRGINSIFSRLLRTLTAWKYSPLHYIMPYLITGKELLITPWMKFVMFMATATLSIYFIYQSTSFVFKHFLFTLGLVLYLDYWIFRPIFGFTLFYAKTISTIVDLFIGMEYVPYLSSIWKELKKVAVRRSAYWIHIASIDSNFRVYFWASFIFMFSGFIKVFLDLLHFGTVEWYPCLFKQDFDDLLMSTPHSLNPINCPHCVIKFLSKSFSIFGFTIFGLLFLIWDTPDSYDSSRWILSIFTGILLFAIGFLCVHHNGPFSDDPFQLIGLLYTIYAEDVSEAESSAASIATGGYDCARPSPLVSPLQALKGNENRNLALRIPQLAVAFLCDTGLVKSFYLFDAWFILRPIIRAASRQWLAEWIETLSIFQILESLKSPCKSHDLTASFQSTYFRSPFEEIPQEEREQKLLLGSTPTWNIKDVFSSLFLNPKPPISNYFIQGRHGRHFCRLLLESFIYGALISVEMIELPKGSIITALKGLGWVLWALFWTTLIPRAISQENLFDELFRDSPKNVLRSLFARHFLYSSANGLGMTFKQSISHVSTNTVRLPAHVDLLRWFIYSQPFGYAKLPHILSWRLLGLPMNSRFVNLFFLRFTALVLGIWYKTTWKMQFVLLITIGSTFLMTYLKPWHWMDFMAILTINSLIWGWKPSIRMISNAPYISHRQQLIDESLTIWMACSMIFGMICLWWLIPHMPAKMARPTRIIFQIVSTYILHDVPKYLFFLFGGNFNEFGSLLGTGVVFFSISAFQTWLYKKTIYNISYGRLWNGIRISYAQGDAIKLFDSPSNSQQHSTTTQGGLVALGPCKSVQSFWLDDIVEKIGGCNISLNEIYPSLSKSPSIFDMIDAYFFPNDDNFSERRHLNL